MNVYIGEFIYSNQSGSLGTGSIILIPPVADSPPVGFERNTNLKGEFNPALDPDIGSILMADGTPVGINYTWQRAVAGIAFGGLVPQSSESENGRLPQAICFAIKVEYLYN